jgi:hypothetical protein
LGKHRPHRQRRERKAETRGVEAVTVIWMMSVITTVVCGGVAALVLLTTSDRAGAEYPKLFGRLLHFSAFVSAVVSLVLLGVVLKVRSEPPPPAISWFAAVVALLVIGTAFLY